MKILLEAIENYFKLKEKDWLDAIKRPILIISKKKKNLNKKEAFTYKFLNKMIKYRNSYFKNENGLNIPEIKLLL